jgi:hypothetical protein
MLDEREHSKVRKKTFVKLETDPDPILAAINETGQINKVKRDLVYLELGKKHDLLDKNNLKMIKSLIFYCEITLFNFYQVKFCCDKEIYNFEL